MAESFDTIVIGGGPGGYVAAIRAAQLGRRTAVVERDRPGGRCLNYACIPAKAMLRSAEHFDGVKNAGHLGIVATDMRLDWDAVGARRAAVSERLSNGVKFLWDRNKVTMIPGAGSLTAAGNVMVEEDVYEAESVILATGSVALPIPGVGFGGRVVNTWGAWSLPEQPRRIAVVGCGASGAELASAYSRFGTEVLIFEAIDQILPAEDPDVSAVVQQRFRDEGIEISTGTPVRNVEPGPDSVSFTYGDKSATVDYLCVAGGRAPDVEGLGLDRAGIRVERKKVVVDEYGVTGNPKVFAIGDLVRGKALAHKASEEAVVAAERAAGIDTHPVDQGLVVGATFTSPQVASVGLTEPAAREAGHEVRVSRQNLDSEGAGVLYEDEEGFVKLIVDATDGHFLGAHMVGDRACDMIVELVATMALDGGYRELGRVVHPYPTASKAILDAARALDGWSIGV
jgi:dihydrolipoamide dehydrogenase